jgi:hypothetical protein
LMSVSFQCCMLSGRDLCDGPIPRSEEFCPLWCVWVWSDATVTQHTHSEFYVYGSVHPEYRSIIVQQDATIYSLLYFCKLLYIFRVVTPPIVRSTYNYTYSTWHWSNRLWYLPLYRRNWNFSAIAEGSRDTYSESVEEVKMKSSLTCLFQDSGDLCYSHLGYENFQSGR